MRRNIVEAIERFLSTAFPKALSLKVSNYSKSDSDQLCHINNVEVVKVVLDQLAAPRPLSVVPKAIPTNDLFFLYRGNYEGK
jgi:hypothetical protein